MIIGIGFVEAELLLDCIGMSYFAQLFGYHFDPLIRFSR